MKEYKSKRERKIDKFLSQLETQEEWEHKMNLKIQKLYEKYPIELEDYTFVKNEEEYNNIKKGGYIRYFNLNDEIRWGGILLKKYKYEEMNMMILGNSSFKRFIVCFDKNTIFYKKHTTQADKTRKLFLSYLDKYDE